MILLKDDVNKIKAFLNAFRKNDFAKFFDFFNKIYSNDSKAILNFVNTFNKLSNNTSSYKFANFLNKQIKDSFALFNSNNFDPENFAKKFE